MDRITLLKVANSSERLRELLAASIRVGIQRVLGYEMHLSEARDLARVHTLSSAIEEIEKKIQVHEGLQDTKRRTKLAIHETIVTGPQENQLTQDRWDAIVKSREVTHTLQTGKSTGKATVSEILRLQREVTAWGIDYRRFLRSVFDLYKLRRRELEALNLGASRTTQVTAELDSLFMKALDKSVR
jgi:hypothetical protein